MTLSSSEYLVMTTPAKNCPDEVCRTIFEAIQNHLNTKHADSFMIYSLDRLSSDQLSDRKGFSQNRV